MSDTKLNKDSLQSKDKLKEAIKPLLDKKLSEKKEQLKKDTAKKLFSESSSLNLDPAESLLKIMVKKTRMPVHFESGETMEVDPQSSEVLFTVMNKMQKSDNAEKMKRMMVKSKADFMKVLEFATSMLTKGHENPGN